LANKNVRSKVIRALERAGFHRDEGGRHTILFDPHNPRRHTTIPRHTRIKPRLLNAILKQCRLTIDEFLGLYR